MTLPPLPPPRKRAKTMNKSKPRPSRCTTGLRVAAMTGVTVQHTDGNLIHYTIWTLHHHEALLAYATSWHEVMRTVVQWTDPEHEWAGVPA